LKGEPAIAATKALKVEQKSSDQLKQEVEITRARIEDEVDEMRERIKPKHVCKTAWAMTREHPVRIGIISAATGLSSFFLYKWRMRARVLRALS
jgi:hypothetical protein